MDAVLASGATFVPIHRPNSGRPLRPSMVAAARGGGHATNGSASTSKLEVSTVGEFMTRKEKLRVVKPTTDVETALRMLVEDGISGFPVTDEDGSLVGVVSDYDLLALDSISGNRSTNTNLFPNVDSSWETFHEIQTLVSKNHGRTVGDVMTESPLVLRESSNLDDATRLLLETKHHRLPVVDASGKLVGVLTRGSMMRAAMQRRRECQFKA